MNMAFRFPDLQSFLWMDGHGPYVWSCYAVTFLALLGLIVLPRLQRKRFIREQRILAQRSALRQHQTSEE